VPPRLTKAKGKEVVATTRTNCRQLLPVAVVVSSEASSSRIYDNPSAVLTVKIKKFNTQHRGIGAEQYEILFHLKSKCTTGRIYRKNDMQFDYKPTIPYLTYQHVSAIRCGLF
jgi:hypothetical protein